jgi:hypothetical protein
MAVPAVRVRSTRVTCAAGSCWRRVAVGAAGVSIQPLPMSAAAPFPEARGARRRAGCLQQRQSASQSLRADQAATSQGCGTIGRQGIRTWHRPTPTLRHRSVDIGAQNSHTHAHAPCPRPHAKNVNDKIRTQQTQSTKCTRAIHARAAPPTSNARIKYDAPLEVPSPPCMQPATQSAGLARWCDCTWGSVWCAKCRPRIV